MKARISDALWGELEKVLPPLKPRRFRYPGRFPIDRRRILEAVLYSLENDVPWDRNAVFQENFGCTGMTCWNFINGLGQTRQAVQSLLQNNVKGGPYNWSRFLKVGQRLKYTTKRKRAK